MAWSAVSVGRVIRGSCGSNGDVLLRFFLDRLACRDEHRILTVASPLRKKSRGCHGVGIRVHFDFEAPTGLFYNINSIGTPYEVHIALIMHEIDPGVIKRILPSIAPLQASLPFNTVGRCSGTHRNRWLRPIESLLCWRSWHVRGFLEDSELPLVLLKLPDKAFIRVNLGSSSLHLGNGILNAERRALRDQVGDHRRRRSTDTLPAVDEDSSSRGQRALDELVYKCEVQAYVRRDLVDQADLFVSYLSWEVDAYVANYQDVRDTVLVQDLFLLRGHVVTKEQSLNYLVQVLLCRWLACCNRPARTFLTSLIFRYNHGLTELFS